MDEAVQNQSEGRAGGTRTKAIVAIAAGAVLLLGGGGTLAYWSTTATLGGGTVVSGDLDLQPAGASTWTLTPEGGTAVPVTDLSAIDIVPGDTLTLTGDFALTLVGDNLVADLVVADIATLPTGILPPVVSVTDDTGATFPGTGLTDALNGEVVSVEVAFQFDPATSGTTLTTTDFVFEDVSLTLSQVDPTP
ncbi:alternate-type signal peptide domain-containing protein [Microbacterium sp. CIAB417]|uniref:alternate-type signal peptide domain-containing protein n=1 Tax=Microbacterium sp. CIAB417 TaxID=2860287 RepID=UPI001FAD034B|nr:alternate-type signal peptide domain-containing protein [Microbacterium sp. CIAB417]